jgi:hypothetical protein
MARNSELSVAFSWSFCCFKLTLSAWKNKEVVKLLPFPSQDICLIERGKVDGEAHGVEFSLEFLPLTEFIFPKWISVDYLSYIFAPLLIINQGTTTRFALNVVQCEFKLSQRQLRKYVINRLLPNANGSNYSSNHKVSINLFLLLLPSEHLRHRKASFHFPILKLSSF